MTISKCTYPMGMFSPFMILDDSDVGYGANMIMRYWKSSGQSLCPQILVEVFME